MKGNEHRLQLSKAKRVVVKVGTGVVARSDGRLALGRMGDLVEQLSSLRAEGREVILVTSGAVGLGAERLGFTKKPVSIVDRQACAAAGQSSLMAFYDGLFRRMGGSCAQVLLTGSDFKERHRYVHLAGTLQRLLDLGCVPIINENDTVSTAELALTGPTVFGDNDRLSALVASGLDADALVLLSDVDGVYDRPPKEPGAIRISVFGEDSDVRLGSSSALGRGGMGAKIAAAQQGAESGVQVVVANGHEPGVLAKIFAGEDEGTLFVAAPRMNRRRRWLAYATVPAGRLLVNEGAVRALTDKGASLLLPGVIAVEGEFEEGGIVSVVGPDGVEFARGRCERSSGALRQAIEVAPGKKSRAVVHRDHVVLMQGGSR